MKRVVTSVTITDPLIKYQSLVATGAFCPDPAQHRLAVHLAKLYRRLKDYSPSVEYRTRLNAITAALNQPVRKTASPTLAVDSHPIRRNPFFAPFFARTEGQDNLALTRILTSHEEAINIDSPQGLFLSGEVGTGKSMLLDLLADGLPTDRKRRWHFNTFMLYTVSQLEQHRRSSVQATQASQEYSLLWMAKKLVEESPILFLDEFQLPDRASSKILSNLFTVFFQLGGVLVASSNRMPEELERATGFEYVAPPNGGLLGKMLGIGKRGKGELFGSSSDFATFLEVLKARCEFWQMEGAKDWRKREAHEDDEQPSSHPKDDFNPSMELSLTAKPSIDESASSPGALSLPEKYCLTSDADGSTWSKAIQTLVPRTELDDISWVSTDLVIYGRNIKVPQTYGGLVFWNFEELVSSFGPADYITMASTFHTFIIDQIPILYVARKNEARRLITLLDALYEARCKLIVRAEAGPDDIFFPESKIVTGSKNDSPQHNDLVDSDATYSETIAEVYQDQTTPFRLNISTYKESDVGYDPDQDSDFGLEKSRLDFSNTGAFTGEDERFAYKRAASRLWELCGTRWHARSGEWWVPLPKEARHWEKSPVSTPINQQVLQHQAGDIQMGTSIELDEPAGLQRPKLEDFEKLYQTKLAGRR